MNSSSPPGSNQAVNQGATIRQSGKVSDLGPEEPRFETRFHQRPTVYVIHRPFHTNPFTTSHSNPLGLVRVLLSPPSERNPLPACGFRVRVRACPSPPPHPYSGHISAFMAKQSKWISRQVGFPNLLTLSLQFSLDFRTDHRFWRGFAQFGWSGVLMNFQLYRQCSARHSRSDRSSQFGACLTRPFQFAAHPFRCVVHGGSIQTTQPVTSTL
ncbi:hypothetical protein AVEN_220382-1 [Araneus ventricosus]|uniref:Uncharacterized protein n=1 Tax=Araneus ventricosus TaxID=182803 RepID=A0A4Y2SEE6_ARAVE|nr:hypothetical protein AVEN_220382-1 [Araneus ventricosus]